MSEHSTKSQLTHLIPPKPQLFQQTPASILYYIRPFSYNNDNVPFTKFLKVFFDFAYIFCLSPFRVKLHGSRRHGNQKYIPIRSFLQSSFCLISSFLGIFWHLQGIRKGLSPKSKDPSNYFIIAQKIVGATGKLLTIKVLWWNQKDILGILNHILKSGRSKYRVDISQRCKHTGKVAFFICLAYTGITVLDFLALRGLGKTGASSSVRYISNWTIKSWWEAIVKQGRINFGMESSKRDGEFKIENIFIGVAASVGLFQRRINGSFFELFLLHVLFGQKQSAFQNLSVNQTGLPYPGPKSKKSTNA